MIVRASALKDDIQHGMAVYNPALLRRDELKRCFVVRQDLLQSVVDNLKHDKPLHRLLLGVKGMGKTTLLRRIAVAVEEDYVLYNTWLPLVLPEDQYNVANLAGLWCNCLDTLCDVLEQYGGKDAAGKLAKNIASLPKGDSLAALQLLLDEAESHNKRLLLLVDNFDLILYRLKEERRQLLEILRCTSRISLIGTAAPELVAEESNPDMFAGIFHVDKLADLNLQEIFETLRNLAVINNSPSTLALIDHDPARIQTLHTLAGGNPRVAILLYNVLTQNIENGNVLTDLDGLLDQVTPLYKTRLESFPAQAQQLVDALASHWDPITAHQLAEVLDWQVNQVSAQLSRLEQHGIVEKRPPPTGKRIAFQLVDRFFNIWYLMRSSRRSRRKLLWLTRFLRIFYHSNELQQLAGQRLNAGVRYQHEADYNFALAHAVSDSGLRMALENQALVALLTVQKTHSKIRELLDFDISDAELLPRLERMMQLREIRQLFDAALAIQDVDFDKRRFGDFFSGSLALPLNEKAAIARILATLSCDQWQKLKEILIDEYQQHLSVFGPGIDSFYHAVAAGEINSGDDLQGAYAAALHYARPELLAIAAYFTTAYDSRPASVTVEAIEEAYRALLRIYPSAPVWNSFGDFLQIVSQHLDAAEYAYRQALALNEDNADYNNNLACLFLRRRDKLPEAVCFAERAVQLDAGNFRALYTLLELLLLTDRMAEFDEHLRRYLEDGSDDFHRFSWIDTLTLIKKALQKDKNQAQDLLAILDSGVAAERWRPLREALMTITCGNSCYLNGIAPEVRAPTENILRILQSR